MNVHYLAATTSKTTEIGYYLTTLIIRRVIANFSAVNLQNRLYSTTALSSVILLLEDQNTILS